MYSQVSNSLNPDQVRHLVGPNRGPNCLQNKRAIKGGPGTLT